MIRSEIITPWSGAGEDTYNAYRPRLCDDHAILKYEDATGQPASSLPLSQNTYVVLVECEESVLAEIEADDTYYVLWSEVIDNV